VFLFHKADLVALKEELSKFWETFEQSNSYIRIITENWIFFKLFIMDLILKYVPQKNCKSYKNLHWLNRSIKFAMQNRKLLYDHAKLSNLKTDWDAYHKAKNQVNNMLESAHCAYQSRLFDRSFSGNYRQFWKYIRSMCKEPSGIPILLKNNTAIGKASILNTHIRSISTKLISQFYKIILTLLFPLFPSLLREMNHYFLI